MLWTLVETSPTMTPSCELFISTGIRLSRKNSIEGTHRNAGPGR
jgi:hypothetical protein